jgi:hypothetical protein
MNRRRLGPSGDRKTRGSPGDKREHPWIHEPWLKLIGFAFYIPMDHDIVISGKKKKKKRKRKKKQKSTKAAVKPVPLLVLVVSAGYCMYGERNKRMKVVLMYSVYILYSYMYILPTYLSSSTSSSYVFL